MLKKIVCGLGLCVVAMTIACEEPKVETPPAPVPAVVTPPPAPTPPPAEPVAAPTEPTTGTEAEPQ